MKNTVLLFMALCMVPLNKQAQEFKWAAQTGGVVLACSADPTGNVYLTGIFSGVIDLDPGSGTFTVASNGSFDTFVLKLTSSGNFLWGCSFGHDFDDLVGDIVAASDGVYIGGRFRGITDFDPGPGTHTLQVTGTGTFDAYILKLDANGNFVWVKDMAGPDDEIISSLALAGNDIVAGGGVNGAMVAKFKSAGVLQWERHVLNAGISQVIVGPSGDIIAGGSVNGTADFDPSPATNTYSSKGSDIFVLKLDGSGNFVWARATGGDSHDYCTGIAADSDSNIYLTGEFEGIVDLNPGTNSNTFAVTPDLSVPPNQYNPEVFVLSLNGNGDYRWAMRLGNSGVETARAIAVDLLDRVYVSATFHDHLIVDAYHGADFTSNGFQDILLLKLDADGEFMWAGQIGGPSNDAAPALDISGSNEIYVGGGFTGTADLDPTTGVEQRDAQNGSGFVIKLNGNVEMSVTGLTSQIDHQFSIFPNPATDQVSLQFNDNAGGLVYVTDVRGCVCQKISFSGNTCVIDTRSLSPGVYFVTVESKNFSHTGKIVLQ